MSDKDRALPASQDRAAGLRPQPATPSSRSSIPSADDLMQRLELLAAWKKRGGPTPGEKMPSTYKTVVAALAHIRALEDALSKFAAEVYARRETDLALGLRLRQASNDCSGHEPSLSLFWKTADEAADYLAPLPPVEFNPDYVSNSPRVDRFGRPLRTIAQALEADAPQGGDA